MNLTYLGDALDHWKGSILELLQARGLLDNFAIFPMATDAPHWKQADVALYAALLRVPREAVLMSAADPRDQRRYFGSLGHHKGDVFLDPDTGVATCRVSERGKYVQPVEIWRLLSNGMNRMVVVYQHVRAQRVSDRVDAVLKCLNAEAGLLHWCTYESGTVAMLFLSMAPHRTAAVADAFCSVLGRHAAGRIRSTWNTRSEPRVHPA